MEISSLLGHTSQLLKLIVKSQQPPDLITSSYLRQKKYIGSHDRKFISETLFLTLRMLNLSEFCINPSINKINQSLVSKKYAEILDKDYLTVIATVITSEIYKSDFDIKINGIINALTYNNANPFDFVTNSIANRFEISQSDIRCIIEQIIEIFDNLDNISGSILRNMQKITEDDLEILAKRFSIQKWILEQFISNKYYKLNIKQACHLAESLLLPAPLTLRANVNNNTDTIIKKLRESGIECEKCNYAPKGIILNKRGDLSQLKLFRDGLLEVQDEGSQLISYGLNPESGDLILDACAGAGGKTLHIASLMNDKGKIIACDVETNKLKELNKRAARFGYKSIETVTARNLESRIKKTNYSENLLPKFNLGRRISGQLFDKILIDAPCSGMGTSRRNPMLKWRLTPELLQKRQEKQLKILSYYSQFLKPDGILLYSTCSIMSIENQEVIEKFLNENPDFEPEPIMSGFTANNVSGLSLDSYDYQIQLLPSVQGCDGFYMAKLKKTE